MNITKRCICGASMLALLAAGPAYSQAIQYRDSDNINNVNVSVAQPLPVTVSGGGSNAAAGATGSTVPSSAGYNGLNVGGTLRGQTGTNTSGSTYAGDTNVVQSALPTNAAVETGGNLASIASNTTALANAIGSPIPAATTGGVTGYGLQTGASTNSTLVSTGAHTLLGINLINTSTTIYYLRMYDASGAPTCSSATGFTRTWPVPPAAASGGAGGIAVHLPIQGVAFANGLGFCVTGGPSSTDNTNAATGVFINLDYK